MSRDERRDEKYARLTSAPVYPLLWRMAVPAMIGMLVTSVYSMTDTFFVGKLVRTDLTAAVGVVFSFTSTIQAIGFWFGYGSGNYIARQIGRKNIREAEYMASVGCTIAVITGLCISGLGLMLIRPLAYALGAGSSDALYQAVIRYLRITLISVPFMLVSNVLYNQLRLQGSARDSMTGLLAGMLLNMLLDPVFIIVLKMEIAGAAVASLVGQISGAAILYRRTHQNGNVSVRPFKAKPDFAHVREMLSGGAPNFCRQGISSISGVVLNFAAGGFGVTVIAGMTIALRILSVGYALVIGFGQGFQPVCLINFGAGKITRIKKAFRYALGTATVFLALAAVVLFFGSHQLAATFSADETVIRTAADFLRSFSFALPFMGYYILIGMLMQNIGKFGQATLITTMENGLFLIPLALVMPHAIGYSGLVWCKPAASMCALLASLMIGGRAWKTYLSEEQERV